jgi:hypothetical protein
MIQTTQDIILRIHHTTSHLALQENVVVTKDILAGDMLMENVALNMVTVENPADTVEKDVSHCTASATKVRSLQRQRQSRLRPRPSQVQQRARLP